MIVLPGKWSGMFLRSQGRVGWIAWRSTRLGSPGRPKAGGGAIGTTRGLRPRGPAEGRPLRMLFGSLAIFTHRDARPEGGAASRRGAARLLFLVERELLRERARDARPLAQALVVGVDRRPLREVDAGKRRPV